MKLTLKHSPAPWKCEPSYATDAPSGWVKDRDGVPVCEVYGQGQPTNTHNAKLISAAPDLFEALQNITAVAEKMREVLELQGKYEMPNGYFNQAYKAIAKAGGVK